MTNGEFIDQVFEESSRVGLPLDGVRFLRHERAFIAIEFQWIRDGRKYAHSVMRMQVMERRANEWLAQSVVRSAVDRLGKR